MSEQDCEQLTLFRADSPASRLVLPGTEEARKMTVTSGLRCLELSKRSDPLGVLVKMLLASSTWHSTRCYLTWKISATPCKRLLFRLVASTPRIKENDARLLPTITAEDAGRTGSAKAWKEYEETGRTTGYRLRNWVQNIEGKDGQPILWKTPIASEGANREFYHNSRGEPNLSGMVKLWPTPTTGAGLCGGAGNYHQLKALEKCGEITEEERRSMAAGNGGQLNPDWTEWFMGFPIGWTSLQSQE